MNKFLKILISLALATLLLPGCTKAKPQMPTPYEEVNRIAGLTMTPEDASVSTGGLTLIFENTTDKESIFGEFFALEKKIDGSWYHVPLTIKGDYAFNDIAYILGPGESQEFTLDWSWLYGFLDPGDYRIVKDVLDFRGAGDFDRYYLTAEFTISDP